PPFLLATASYFLKPQPLCGNPSPLHSGADFDCECPVGTLSCWASRKPKRFSTGNPASFFPVAYAPAVPAPAPTSDPMAAPFPPPASAPISAPPPAPPPMKARFLFL